VRIAFVQSGLSAGGAEKVINLLAEHRASLGDRVFVVAHASRAEDSYFPYSRAVDLVTPKGAGHRRLPSFARLPHRLLWLAWRLRSIKPDLVVSFLTKTNVLTLLATRGLGVPVIVSERNNPALQRAHPVWQPASHVLARYALCLVMQTEAARDALPAPLRPKAVVIPNPSLSVDIPQVTGERGERIVAVGRLEQQKGFDLLLKAFARIATDIPASTLTIFGEGQEQGELQALVETLGLSERVRLPGQTGTPGAWLAEADMFVLSSRFEGFPNVLVEALAAGLPSIAFDCPWGPATIVRDGETGLLVPPEDVDALADAIVRLSTDEALRRRLSEMAPAAVERFRLPAVLAQWDALIESAVPEASR
jgi:glycosyltransferase involved in cell wall biosynthesis